MKPVDVKSTAYIDFGAENNYKSSEFEIGDHVRISKCKIVFIKGYTPNWSEDVFMIKRITNAVPCRNVIENLNGEEILGNFYEIEKQIKQGLG